MKRISGLVSVAIVFLVAASGAAAKRDVGVPSTLSIEPASLVLAVGEKARLEVTVLDSRGNEVEAQVVFYSLARQSVSVSASGKVEAIRPGSHRVVVMVPKNVGDRQRRDRPLLRREVEVEVPDPPVDRLLFEGLPERFLAGTSIDLQVAVMDRAGSRRIGLQAAYWSDNDEVATVDSLGRVSLKAPGSVRLGARVEDAAVEIDLQVEPNPIHSLELEADTSEAQTGEVVHFRARALDAEGREITGVPIRFTTGGRVHPAVVAAGASATVDEDGSFLAERSGVYSVVATVGTTSATEVISVRSRASGGKFEVLGQAPVRDRHTSDFWVWSGEDGRDYAITGTWGSDGSAYIWDVTNPAKMRMIDRVRVDARTVNDVKVSADGRIAVIGREGASNRRNGIVILDVSDPRSGVEVLSEFDQQLSGGVHNLFLYEDHAYVINNGRRFDVINIENPTKPRRVGHYQLDTAGNAIHDIWVVEGVAFTSNWKDGVVALDVGGGGIGGSPKQPKILGRYSYPNGWNHSAFPYRSPSTGKFYVFAGDEAFPYARLQTGKGAAPNRAAGWIHIIEWESWDSPREVARYQVPEAGSHNFWIEDDVLYAAFYNGGLRAVDVSGELRGDLYRQGREIAFWKPQDPDGFVPNTAFSWGAQLHGGTVYVSDWNSGLWALRLVREEGRSPVIGEPQ